MSIVSSVALTSASDSQLRLHCPDLSDASRAPDEITLREAFAEYLLPDLLTSSEKSSVDQYWITLRIWERETDDPAVRSISDLLLKSFRDGRAAKGCRNGTVDKNLRNIHTILRRIGPRGDGNPAGKGFIQVVPYCRPLGDSDEPRKRIISRREATALCKACEVATWPRQQKTGISPVALWRRWIVCLYNWGADPKDLKRLTGKSIMPGDGSPRMPRRNRFYVSFVRRKTRRKKKRPIVIPLHPVVLRHVRPAIGTSAPLFPFPQNSRDMKAQWERILADAGIELTIEDDGESIDNKIYFHDFRATCNSAYDEVAPGIGEHILGHAPQDVNRKHYLRVVAGRVRRAVDRLKQPKGFGRFDRQRRMF